MVESSDANSKKVLVKPEKPDEELYKASLKKAEKEHADSMAKLSAIKNQLEIAKPISSDSPSSKRRADLLARLKEIREKQVAGKSSRNKLLDQIKREDAILKELIAQHKTARSRVNFKSVEDLDREIDRLDKAVNTGTMKIVDEKKALNEISMLRKQRKNFSGFEESQKNIDAKKSLIKELRDQFDDPESKALSDQYNNIQAELDEIKAQQDEAYKGINSLRDERKRLQDDQQAKYLAIREIKDNYYEQNRAVQKWDYEVRQKARDKKKADEERIQQEKKKTRAQQILAEASDKAYLDEIRRAHSLLHFLDPSFTPEKAPLLAPSKFQALPQRQVDATGIKGVRIAKKEEEDYFAGSVGKKGKKSKKSTPGEGKYSCPPSVMEDCTFMGIEPPMSAAEIPAVKEKVLAKLSFWKADQEAETERNFTKAKRELERLEAEEAAASTISVTGHVLPHANGDGKATATPDEGGSARNELALEMEAQADVSIELKAVSLEDRT
ncbi:nuclear segregation protein Bfr1 [Blumeria hordei DH14]|uniref:Nuclear segregation protein Bfr1 n=1 Tax=Blumeria graminis f. sp. hordei (strain DH14) TaxID=546991 RepID=N1JA50_BLUG1|nr:nuclear segregation protein Bfr1 [Blumeria hordei DH14]